MILLKIDQITIRIDQSRMHRVLVSMSHEYFHSLVSKLGSNWAVTFCVRFRKHSKTFVGPQNDVSRCQRQKKLRWPRNNYEEGTTQDFLVLYRHF